MTIMLRKSSNLNILNLVMREKQHLSSPEIQNLSTPNL